MLTYWWAVGGHTHVGTLLVKFNGICYQIVNIPQKFMQSHSEIVCIKIMSKDAWQMDDKVIFFSCCSALL